MLRLKGRHGIRLLLQGELNHKAHIIKIKLKILQITGIRNHIPIVIVLKIPKLVDIHPGSPAVTEQLFLVIHLMSMENSKRLVRVDIALFNRHSLPGQLQHFFLDPRQKLLIQKQIPFQGTVVTIA